MRAGKFFSLLLAMRRVMPTRGESHTTSGLMSVALSGVAEKHIARIATLVMQKTLEAKEALTRSK